MRDAVLQPEMVRGAIGIVHLLIGALLLHNENRNTQLIYLKQLLRAQLGKVFYDVLRQVPFIPPQIPPCLHCRRRAVHLPLHFFLLGHGALIPSSFAAFCTHTLHRLRSTETPGMSFSTSPFSTGCTAAVTLPERSTYTMPANTSPSCTAISSSEKRQTFAAHSEHRP